MQLLGLIVRLLQRWSQVEAGVPRSLFLGRLEAELKTGERRTQLVRGIGRKVAFPLQHVVELVDHRIVSFGHAADLGDAAGFRA